MSEAKQALGQLIDGVRSGHALVKIEVAFQGGKPCHVRGTIDDMVPAGLQMKPTTKANLELRLDQELELAAKLDLYGSVCLMFIVQGESLYGVRRVTETTTKVVRR